MSKFTAKRLVTLTGRSPENLRSANMAIIQWIIDEVRERPGREDEAANILAWNLTRKGQEALWSFWRELGWRSYGAFDLTESQFL